MGNAVCSADLQIGCPAGVLARTRSRLKLQGNFEDADAQTASTIGGGRLCVCAWFAGDYFIVPFESMVMPPGPASFFSSLALRVPIALVRQSSALAKSSLTAAALP